MCNPKSNYAFLFLPTAKFAAASSSLRSGKLPNPEKNFLKNVLVMVRDMTNKLKIHGGDKKLLDMIAEKAKVILAEMKASEHEHVPKREMSELIYLFNKFFSRSSTSASAFRTGDHKKQAPFCPLGEDCFGDVDHAKIAMEIKRLAVAMSGYLRDRMKEEDVGTDNGKAAVGSRPSQFKADAVLTHATTVIAKLHRAILRNWHHILMIVGNMGGGAEGKKGMNGRTKMKSEL